MRSPCLSVLSWSPRFVLASLAAALVLAAAGCGGGGGGGTVASGAGSGSSSGSGSGSGSGAGSGSGNPQSADVVDKYIGSWLSTCDATGNNSSENDLLTLTKASATSVTFSDKHTAYATTNCTGNPAGTQTETGTATWQGTKTVNNQTVDEIIIAQQGKQDMKQIVVIGADGKLYSGVEAKDGGPVDGSGYPTTLEAGGSTRQ